MVNGALSIFRRYLSVACVGVIATVGMPTTALADNFPERPLRFVVPYAPGGPLDTMARLLAEKAESELGVITVENKPGAGGNIGASYVAKAAPDGHTLVMGAVAINAINPWLYEEVPFDPIDSFEPISLVASVPNVLVLNPKFADNNEIASVQDLIDYAKANPGSLNYGSGGNGSAGHLAGELVQVRTGIDMVHVPYAGASPAKMALMSGEVDFMFDNLASAAGLIKEEKVKALAVTTVERSFMFPDMPTMEEAGVEDFDLGTWFGVLTTGGTPEAVVAQLNAAFSKALQSDDVVEALRTMGSEAEPISSAAFKAMLESELEKYKELVEVSGAKIE